MTVIKGSRIQEFRDSSGKSTFGGKSQLKLI